VGILAFSVVPALAQNGPRTPNMQIHIFLHPDPENSALESGKLDLNDWPLSKEWIDRWALMPETITLRDYVEMGMMECDMNNQMWPTGCPDHKFFDPSCQWCQKALAFRKAVAYLNDRDRFVREILKGYAYRLDVPLPPAQSAYIDMYNYTSEGLIYDYNKAKAIQILEAADFKDVDGDGIRNDPRKWYGPDETPDTADDVLTSASNLDPLIFYIRMDDPNRMTAGLLLADELESVGIPVKKIVTERTVCYKNVMILYHYNLYTGGWSLGTIPDQYFDLYSSYTYYGPEIGWSVNYPGFCNHEFDEWATKVKYPDTIEEAQEAAKVCGYLFLKYCPVVPWWSSAAVKAYRTGWQGVVNNVGYGIDNYWTFLNMYKSGDDTIDWGFKSDIEQLNMISSEWLWDHNVLGLIYETMMGTNPFNLATTEFFIAEDYSLGTWEHLYEGEYINGTVVIFKIREGITWHDGTPLTIEDVQFSYNFTYACGPGVAWLYPTIKDMNRTQILNETAIAIYFNHKSAWALDWAAGIPIIKAELWSKITDSEGRTWRDPDFDFTAVRSYDPASTDIDNDGTIDLIEDGTGAWVYGEYEKGNYITLSAYTGYYLSQSFISSRLTEMFWSGAGDVSKDGEVTILDVSYMQRALGTDVNMTHGTGWDQFNSDCDLNGDGKVTFEDYIVTTTNFGRTIG